MQKIWITFLRLLNKIGVLQHISVSYSLQINNHHFRIPVIYGMGLQHLHTTETWMIQLLKNILPSPELSFIDVGVNIGQTLLKIKSIYPNVPYIGFEPNPHCVCYTSMLIEKNSLQGVTLIPAGIHHDNIIAVLDLYQNKTWDNSASIVHNFRNQPVYKKLYVPVFKDPHLWVETLQKTSIGCIKIDVEGAEWFVVQGIMKLIEKNRPLLLIEILPYYDAGNKERIERGTQLVNYLQQLHYRLYRIIPEKNNYSLQPLSQITIHNKLEWSNYLFVPEEKTSLLTD